jgi:hypothetical protein
MKEESKGRFERNWRGIGGEELEERNWRRELEEKKDTHIY